VRVRVDLPSIHPKIAGLGSESLNKFLNGPTRALLGGRTHMLFIIVICH